MNPSISILIPNYNGRKLLEENLPSVFAALKKAGSDYEIIIADDASTDDSVSFLKKNYPDIRIITSSQNTGFSANANKAIKLASKKLSLILNTDVKLNEDYFLPLFTYFDHPDTFGVMGSILSPSGKLIDSAKFPRWRGQQIISTLNYYLKNAPPGLWMPTYFLSGANALVDTGKIQRLGGFDEIYSPFYMEDVDLSVRAWRMGWNCYYEPKAKCFHDISDTISRHSTKHTVKLISKRNKFIFHEIHLTGRKKFLFRAKIILGLFYRWLWLDFGYYRSFSAFEQRKKLINLSQKKLSDLKPLRSLEKIVGEIQEKVEKYEKGFF